MRTDGADVMTRAVVFAALLVLLCASTTRADAPHTTPQPPPASPPTPPPATPPPSPWRDLYHRGSAAYDAGQLDEALSDFTAALARGGPPTLLYDMALTIDRLGRVGDAIVAYRRYLDASPDASNRDVVEARLAELQAPSPSRASPILSLAPADTAAPAIATGDGAYLATHPLATGDHWEQRGPEWVASWVMLGLTAASVAGAIIAWNIGLGQFAQLQDLCGLPMGCTSVDVARSSAHASQDATNALLGVSIGLGAITILTFVVEGVVTGNRTHFVRGGASRTRGPTLSMGVGGLAIAGTF